MGSPSAVTTIDSPTPHHSVEQYRSYLLCDAMKKVNQGVGLLQCDKEELVSIQSIINFVPSLDLYLFRPKENISLQEPIYIYLPASFVGMNSDIFGVICKKMCALSQMTIAAFRYPLAPETSISGQINAVAAAYEKLFDCENLNVDPKRIILGGYSSGSFLALHLVKKRLDQKLPLPLRLLLSFPVFDVNGKIEGNDKDPIVEKSLIAWLFAQLFINEPRSKNTFSLLGQDFSDFPPMAIITSDNDYLANHAAHLKKLNPKTEMHNLGNISHTDFWYDPEGLMLLKLSDILVSSLEI